MKKIALIFAASALALVAWAVLRPKKEASFPVSGMDVRTVRIRGADFRAEMAQTPAQRSQGLSGRKELCAGCAMLFVFQAPGEYTFWMKDMHFDLDMLWIADSRIVDISKNVPAQGGENTVVRPDQPVDKVLEINAGTSDRLGIRVGDSLEIE